MIDALGWLQNWYARQCDGDWEHDYGVEIGSIDNPGWRVRINCLSTVAEGHPFTPIKIERSEIDWLHAWVENSQFNAACGPRNLIEALEAFRDWAGGKVEESIA